MANAGHPTKIEVSPDGTTWTDLKGINSFKSPFSREMLEKTAFGDECRKRMAGLKDGSVDASGAYEEADAGQIIVRDAFEGGSDLHVRTTYNAAATAGQKGFVFVTIVESHEIGDEVDGLIEWSFSAQFNGAWAAY